jgi:hypothetical protein
MDGGLPPVECRSCGSEQIDQRRRADKVFEILSGNILVPEDCPLAAATQRAAIDGDREEV